MRLLSMSTRTGSPGPVPRGVNVTVGLPIPRTSVDHGTAYDIAGKGIAEAESLLEAYTLAESFVAKKRKR